MQEYCHWCSSPVEVKDTFDRNKNISFCCVGCRDAETLFRLYYDDEEMNRRAHYHSIMRGLSDEQG